MKDGNHSAKVVEELTRRIRVTFQGEPLSPHDTALFRVALQIQSALLRDLLPGDDAWRAWCAFLGEADLSVERLSDTIKYADSILKEYPSVYLDNDFLSSSDHVVRSASGFKRQMRDRKLYWGFVAPMAPLWDEYFRTVSPGVCAQLNQWVNFLSHITLRDIDLRSSLIAEYVALEEEEGLWEYDATTLAAMNRTMCEWLHGLSFENLIPSHGPGAVAELNRNSGRLAKYRVMTTDARLNYFILHSSNSIDDLLPPGGFLESRSLDRTSALICVPKSMTKNRTISKEPCSLQYFQHGVQRRLDEYLQEHPVLSGRIDLHKQDLSKDLAARGSVRGEWDTVDLSAASDSITTRLIKAVFASTPYLRPLICLRSDNTVLPDGRIVRLQKYAPMGSDLCFPTMCLVFACVCEQAVWNVTGRTSRLNDYRVYGDDIVVRHAFTPEVLRLLDELHFKVNARKSFTTRSLHNFREACGGEYVDGFDVAPIRISRRMRLNEEGQGLSVSSVEATSSYVELCNEFFERGLLEARRATMRALARLCPFYKELPYTGLLESGTLRWGRSTYVLPTYSTAFLTHSWCCTNYRLPSRFSGSYGRPGLHVVQYLTRIAITSATEHLAMYRECWTSDDVRYFEYWLTLPDRPYRTEGGVQYAPEPSSGLYPERPAWRRKWVSALR